MAGVLEVELPPHLIDLFCLLVWLSIGCTVVVERDPLCVVVADSEVCPMFLHGGPPSVVGNVLFFLC